MFRTYLFNKFLNFTEHRFLPVVSKASSTLRQRSFSDIGIKQLSAKAPRALVINISTAIPYYIEGDINRCPILDGHALYWETGELVRQLNAAGYVVDFIDCYKVGATIDWQKYHLVFDERNNLMFAPKVDGQKRIFYCTGLQWAFHNQQELQRVDWFHQRTGIREYPQRFLYPNYSDEFADYQTFYGRADRMRMFSDKPVKVALDVSCTFIPESLSLQERKENRFVWFGSSGSLHKGLDLTVEAFRELSDYELHIFGPAYKEKRFYAWLQAVCERHPNIRYHGIADLKNRETQRLLSTAIANVFPSCSENGAGSVAQAALFGLVPIVAPGTNLRYEDLGYVVNDSSDQAIIESIRQQVLTLSSLSPADIREKSEAVYAYARQHHTREAYQKSLQNFLQTLF